MATVLSEPLPKVSIIIPCKHIDNYTEQCIRHIKELDYSDFETIVLPDEDCKKIEGVKIVSTGNVPPGRKRNIGVTNSSGDLLAFIDDDAYPRKDWLKNAVKYFNDDEMAAVGGPGVAPEDDNDMQKAGGCVLSSFLVGNLSSRFKIKNTYESDDIHSCNFIARRWIIEKVRWDEKYWPGEDTLMCLGIRKMGMKMLETPDVVVCHHRRSLFIPHIKQISRFGLHRGFFAKKFPENSLKITYFIPSLFVLSIPTGLILSIVNQTVRTIFALSLLTYLILAFIGALDAKRPKVIILTWLGIIITHIAYGIVFLVGLAKKELKR